MAEFETSGSVVIEVDSSSLRDARREVEESIGSVQVDVDGGGGASSMADGGQTRLTRTLDEGLNLDAERNELLLEIVDLLDEDGGGLFGGGGDGGVDGDGGGGGIPGMGFLGGFGARGILGRLGGLAGLGGLGGLGALGGLNLGARGAGGALSGLMFGGMGVRTAEPGSERLIPGGPDDPIGESISRAMEDAVSGVQQTFQDLSDEQLSVTQDPNIDLPQQTLDLNLPQPLQDLFGTLGGGPSGSPMPGMQGLRPRVQAQRESLQRFNQQPGTTPLGQTERQRFDQRANQVQVDVGDISMTVDDVTDVEDTVNRKLSQAKREIQQEIMDALETDPRTAQRMSTNQLKQLYSRF